MACWDILKRKEAEVAARKPSPFTVRGRTMAERFSVRHVFINRHCAPLNARTTVYLACCVTAGQADVRGRRHSTARGCPWSTWTSTACARTFFTDLIVNGTDPRTVQELLGHKTLTMTMNLYARCDRKASAPGRGPAVLRAGGDGAGPPDRVPGRGDDSGAGWSPIGHRFGGAVVNHLGDRGWARGAALPTPGIALSPWQSGVFAFALCGAKSGPTAVMGCNGAGLVTGWSQPRRRGAFGDLKRGNCAGVAGLPNRHDRQRRGASRTRTAALVAGKLQALSYYPGGG